MPQKNILIICGEASGDLNAADLAKKILETDSTIRISGVGGKLLRQAGVEVFYDIKDISVFGFFDVLNKLPRFLALKKLILKKIETEKPDLIIMVDFSGFNLRLAKAINKTVPIIYYVSPQVWASRQGRIKTIKKYIAKMIVIFAFEEDFYRNLGINVNFVGHPLLDIVRPTMEKKDFLEQCAFSESKFTIALLPGSRKQEIKYIFPIMLRAACIIKKKMSDVQFIIAKTPNLELGTYKQIMGKFKEMPLKIAEGKTYDALNIADFCLVASGTATLETTIMEKPFFIIYKTGLLNYLLYLPQVKVPYIGMVNIVAKRKVIPEFIQFKASPKKIAAQLIETLADPAKIGYIKNGLARVKSLLGEKGASLKAAQIVIDFLRNS